MVQYITDQQSTHYLYKRTQTATVSTMTASASTTSKQQSAWALSDQLLVFSTTVYTRESGNTIQGKAQLRCELALCIQLVSLRVTWHACCKWQHRMNNNLIWDIAPIHSTPARMQVSTVQSAVVDSSTVPLFLPTWAQHLTLGVFICRLVNLLSWWSSRQTCNVGCAHSYNRTLMQVYRTCCIAVSVYMMCYSTRHAIVAFHWR
jgi:hypothetical protein